MEARHIFALLALMAAAACRPAVAQEFRIETDVYVGDDEKSTSHTVTLFEKAAVYEFIDEPEQVIIYRQGTDGAPSRFIVLDAGLQRRTEIDADRVTKLMAKLAKWASEHKDPVLKFAAKPEFKETFDAETGSLKLANPVWTYSAATVAAEDPQALVRYREFTDRYVELTSMIFNTPLPPGPRQELNAALAAHKVVPVEIRRTIGGDEKNEVRAVHTFSWRLSREDRTRLDEAQKQLASFVKVDNEAFLAARRKQDAVRGQSE